MEPAEERTLQPTPEAITWQLKKTCELIDRAFRYAQYGAELINRGKGGREVALSITKLQEAQMWTGQALNEVGHELPEESRVEREN